MVRSAVELRTNLERTHGVVRVRTASQILRIRTRLSAARRTHMIV